MSTLLDDWDEAGEIQFAIGAAQSINGVVMSKALKEAYQYLPGIVLYEHKLSGGGATSNFDFVNRVACAKIFLDHVIVKGRTPFDCVPYARWWAYQHGICDDITAESLVLAAQFGLTRYWIDGKWSVFQCGSITLHKASSRSFESFIVCRLDNSPDTIGSPMNAPNRKSIQLTEKFDPYHEKSLYCVSNPWSDERFEAIERILHSS